MNTINKRSFNETTTNSMSQLFSSAEFMEQHGNAEYEVKYRIGTNDKGMFEYQISLVKVKEADDEKF